MSADQREYRPDVYVPELLDTWLSIAKRQAAKDEVIWSLLSNHLVPGKVLELGAGVGQITELLINMGRTVVSSDYAEFFVTHMLRQGLNAHQVDATQIGQAGLGSFPNIICQSITPFVTTDYSVVERSYRSVYETLEANGRLVLIHAMNKHYAQLPGCMADHKKLCEAAGFTNVQVFRNQLLPSAAYRAPLNLLARPLEKLFARSFGMRFVVVASKRNV